MTTGTPHLALRSWATILANVSAPPPGANPTTHRTDFSGYPARAVDTSQQPISKRLRANAPILLGLSVTICPSHPRRAAIAFVKLFSHSPFFQGHAVV